MKANSRIKSQYLREGGSDSITTYCQREQVRDAADRIHHISQQNRLYNIFYVLF